MASQAKKLAIRAVGWFAGLILALGLFTLVGISLLVDAIDRLVHWGRPTDEQVARDQRRAASAWWAGLMAKAGGSDAAGAAELCGPAPAEELARLVKEAPAIVLDGSVHDPRPLVVLKPYVRRFGRGALAYTTITNAEFKHFFVPGVGSLAYLQCRRYGRRVIMACNDPMAPEALWRPLTERFFAFEPTAYVSHASREYATVLSAMGKIVNHFGIEPIIKAKEYDFSGPQMRIARQEIRRAREQGLVVRELTASDLRDPATRARLHAVSGGWMRTKRVADRQLRVYCRHFDPDDLAAQLDGEVRLFVAERRDGGSAPSRPLTVATMSEGGLALRPAVALSQNRNEAGAAAGEDQDQTPQPQEPEIEGFMLVDPMYREDGTLLGYVNSSNRMRPGANPGTLKLLMDHVLDLMRQQEGFEQLHLGLTPFHHSRKSFTHFANGAAWMDFGTRFFFKLGNNLYAFKRLSAAKSKFGGGIAADGESYNDPSVVMSHVYVAHSIRYPFLFLMDMYGTFEYIGFVGDDILSSIVKGLAPPAKKEAKAVMQQVGKKELKRLVSVGSLPSMASMGGSFSVGGGGSVGGSFSEAGAGCGGGAGGAGPLLVRAASLGGGAAGGLTVLRARAQAAKGLRPNNKPSRLQTMTSAPAGCCPPPGGELPSAPPPLLERRKSQRPLAHVPSLPPVPGSPVVAAAAAADEAVLHESEDGLAVVRDEHEVAAAAPLSGLKPSSASTGKVMNLTAHSSGGF